MNRKSFIKRMLAGAITAPVVIPVIAEITKKEEWIADDVSICKVPRGVPKHAIGLYNPMTFESTYVARYQSSLSKDRIKWVTYDNKGNIIKSKIREVKECDE